MFYVELGSDHVVQNRQAIFLSGLIQPLQIPMPISYESKKEFPLMASMGDMPDVPRNVMSLCPYHIEENSSFSPRKTNYTPDSDATK